MAAYRFLVQQLSGFFDGCEFHHIPRTDNQAADTLARIGSTRGEIPPGVALEHLYKPSIKPAPESPSIFIPADPGAPPAKLPGAAGSTSASGSRDPGATLPPAPNIASTSGSKDPGAAGSTPAATTPLAGSEDPGAASSSAVMAIHQRAVSQVETVYAVREIPAWTKPYVEFFTEQKLPPDEVAARQIQRRASAYTIINGELYKRSVSGIFMRCVEPEEGRRLLKDIHQGECGHHAGARNIASKALRHGFYWPTVAEDAEHLVKCCNGCQRFSSQKHTPSAALKTIPITWPFAVWGLDMVGPFKTARGGLTHLLVAVDKFTKWIEAKPIKKLDGHTVVKFFQDIILRYGYPHSIITDNGTNFAKGVFARFCYEKHIRLDLASVAHPQANGMAERANGLVLDGIKPRLVEPLQRTPGCWIEELPAVLWSLRTTPNRSTGFTPFFLVYGAEAVLSIDLEHDSPRIEQYTEEEAKEARQDSVDLLEEARDLAASRSAVYQQNLRRYHSRRIKPVAFREGDLVLRRIQRTQGQHKLAPPWEGPYIVTRVLHNGSCYLVDLKDLEEYKDKGTAVESERPWNVELLRPFYT